MYHNGQAKKLHKKDQQVYSNCYAIHSRAINHSKIKKCEQKMCIKDTFTIISSRLRAINSLSNIFLALLFKLKTTFMKNTAADVLKQN